MKPLFTATLALASLVGTARAQTSYTPLPLFFGAVPAEASRLDPALVAAIETASGSGRAEALHTVATLAFTEQPDLRPALPALLSVFRLDSDERLRVLALRTLEASGDTEVMESLRREAWTETQRDAHPQVRRLLFLVLVDHYGLDALRRDADVGALAATLRPGR